ncbi:hypothetical protein GCM10010344_62820 [Streptomyces bluensis]|nr:hypothetical protein GCM10010344_62820 [Streptomyces bluensis]
MLAGFPDGDGAVDVAAVVVGAGAGAGPVPAEAIPAGMRAKAQLKAATTVFG